MTNPGVVGEYVMLDPPENSLSGTLGVRPSSPEEILARVRTMRLLYGDSEYLREAQSLALGVSQQPKRAAV